MQTYNEYRFTTVRSLREALRHFQDLEKMEDAISATILLDLKRALGDTPEPGAGLTKNQRRIIQLYLIENRDQTEVSKIVRRHRRTVQWVCAQGLRALMEFFNGTDDSRKWQPWMLEMLSNSDITMDELVQTLGKSRRAIQCAVTRQRALGATIPYRPVSRRPNRR